MADPKNEPGKTPSNDKRAAGTDSSAGAKVSAGTSVGNIGEAPMPHAHENTKSAQSSTLASHTSKPLGGQGGQGAEGRGHSTEQATQQDRSGKDRSPRTGSEASEQGQQAGGARQATDRGRQRAEEMYEDAGGWAQDTYERVSGWASDMYEGQSGRMSHMRDRSMRRFGNVRGGVQQYVAENPMVVGIVGLAAGLLLGALLPRTRRENEFFGEWADEVRNQGLRYARDAANMGRDYVEETFSGDDPRFSKHESEFRSSDQPSNRH